MTSIDKNERVSIRQPHSYGIVQVIAVSCAVARIFSFIILMICIFERSWDGIQIGVLVFMTTVVFLYWYRNISGYIEE